ncbi:YncE family protein [Filimonas lacunae]|nr:DUF5074 domain-containing protein [Filimonas lacunae]BAV09492.1 cell surface protein [Filimonas lacunae]
MKKLLFAVPMLAAVFFSCSKKDDAAPAVSGVYVLTEGNFSETDSSAIAFYNASTQTVDWNYYKTVNGTKLGNGANDLKQYGGKMYCTVSGKDTATLSDSYVLVIDVATCKLLSKISFASGTRAYQPRFVAFNGNKAYVSCYNGMVCRIDTSSLQIDATVQTDGVLEGIAASGNKLYVANSDNYTLPSTNNSSVSVIDIATFKKTGQISVGFSPIKVAAGSGFVFVASAGNYDDIAASVSVISSATDVVAKTIDANISWFTAGADAVYATGYDGTGSFIKSYNVTTGEGTSFITDGTTPSNIYAATVNPSNGDVYVANAGYAAGKDLVYVFSSAGKLKFQFATSKAPQNCVFLNL